MEFIREQEEKSKKHREEFREVFERPEYSKKKYKNFLSEMREVRSIVKNLKDNWPKGSVGRKIVKCYSNYLVDEMCEYDTEKINTESLVAFIHLIENHMTNWEYFSNYNPFTGAYPQFVIGVDLKKKNDPVESAKQVEEMLKHRDVPLDEWKIYCKDPSSDEADTSITVKNILK